MEYRKNLKIKNEKIRNKSLWEILIVWFVFNPKVQK